MRMSGARAKFQKNRTFRLGRLPGEMDSVTIQENLAELPEIQVSFSVCEKQDGYIEYRNLCRRMILITSENL